MIPVARSDEPPCPLCRAPGAHHYADHPKANQTVFKCTACGFYFVHPHESWIPGLSDDQPAESFEFWGDEDAHRAYADWRNAENERIAQTIIAQGPYDRLLEIGFGEGPLTERISSAVREYWGIEPVQTHYRKTVDRLHLDRERCLNIRAEDMLATPALAERAGTFDAIVMVSVFEHLSQPREIIEACHTLLRPKGMLLISVPDSTFFPQLLLLRRLGGIEPWSRFHISFFDRRCLQQAANESGYRVADVSSHSLVTPLSITYYYRLTRSQVLRAAMSLFAAFRFDRLLRVGTLFYRLEKQP
jgi:SAM-dependent methyltransferase